MPDNEDRIEVSVRILQLVIDEYYNGDREWAKQCLEKAYAALEEFVTKNGENVNADSQNRHPV